MKLIVGTESTWSLRAWICSQLAAIDVEIELIDLTSVDYKTNIQQYSKAGLVPILQVNDICIHDSLAIVEYFNECSEGKLYPETQLERAKARSLCAEMHSGFFALRSNLPFSTDKVPPLDSLTSEITSELQRVTQIFSQAQLPFMFKSPSAVDAFYAILAARLNTYGVELDGEAGKYQQSLLNWDLLQGALSLASGWKKQRV